MIAKSLVLCVSRGTPWMLAVAAIARCNGATARLSTPSLHCGGQTPHSRATSAVMGSRLETQPRWRQSLGSQCALVVVGGDKDTEVQLGYRGRTDGRLDLSWCLSADKDRSVQQCTHALGERVPQVTPGSW